MKEIPDTVQDAIDLGLAEERFGQKFILDCLHNPSPTLYTGTFALEHKRSAEHSVDSRIAMDLCSIQHQRRLLGLKDKRVYGATCAEGTFSLFTSAWRDDVLVSAEW